MDSKRVQHISKSHPGWVRGSALISMTRVINNQDSPYAHLPEFPHETNPGTVLARLAGALGFRLRWASEGLREADYEFRPHPDGSSIGEVLEHVDQLVIWAYGELTRKRPDSPALPELPANPSGAQRREHCLACLWILDRQLLGFDAAALDEVTVAHPARGERPFWVMINGPLSDCLTHVGQISAWRRQAGNPAPQSDPFDGRESALDDPGGVK